jgi:phage minor structural protein
VSELVWLYGLDGNQAGVIADPLDLVVEERLQESETLRFTVRANDSKAYLIGPDRLVRFGTRRYRITDLADVRSGSSVLTEVTAEASWIDLLGYFVPVGTTIIGQTITAGAETLLAGTGWTVGTVDSPGGTFSRSVEADTTVLAELRFWANLVGRELEFDTANSQVNFKNAQGQDRGLGFRWGRNLTSVKRTTLPPEATRLYPIGANGLTPKAVNPTGQTYVEDFSYYTGQGLTLAAAKSNYTRSLIWRDDRYISATNLYDAAVERLGTLAQPRVAYELSVVDLSGLTGSTEVFSVGDTVRVVDEPLGVSLTTRIVRRVTTPLEPAKNAVELSFLAPGLSGVGGNTSTGVGGGGFGLLVDQNLGPATLGAGIFQVHSLSLSFAAQGNLVLGYELDGVATGSGTLTVRFFWGTDQVGPTVRQDFASGNFHLSIPDSLAGLEGSRNLMVRTQVTSGAGTIAIPAESSRFYVLASGIVGGGLNSDTSVSVNDEVTITVDATTDQVTAATQTPTLVDENESTSTTPDATTDSASSVLDPP